ncbi:MAG: ABC transporter ATP-binding protein [Thiotrichales bacterium]|nr:ABC transporter ATP-binding protein [Thiotrichales bacterium]
MEQQTLIEVDQISRYYADHCAVNNVSFTVQRGEVLGFLGPNGAGKSTTMQIICGVQTASQGRVSIAGHDIFDAASAAKSYIGFLPETPPLYLDLTVDEYLRYTARLRNIRSGTIDKALDDCKQRCGLDDTGHRLIRNLSKGYQQRVGIAQAIIHSPAVVILDEPTAGLDPIQIREIRDLIRELGNDHSVILSTHILSEVQTVCDRVSIIHRGRLVLDESIEVLNRQQDNVLLLDFATPPAVDDLKSLDFVTDVTQLDEQRFRIAFAGGHPIHDELCRAALEHGWGLTCMMPESHTLEETFVQLTQQDETGKEVAA